MKRPALFASALFAAVVLAGCSHIPFFGKKKTDPETSQPKVSSHIATQTETEFHQRWVDKRAAELVSQGLTADAARAQAVAEFKAKFPAALAARQ